MNNNTIVIECKETYIKHHYFFVLALYAGKHNIRQDKIDEWFDKSNNYWDKLDTIELALGKVLSETEKETLRIQATIKALKDLGLENKEARLLG